MVGNSTPPGVLWQLRRKAPVKVNHSLTIGAFDGHTFLIKDITKLAKTYLCAHCNATFMQPHPLQRDSPICSKEETRLIFPNRRIEAPKTVFEQAFLPDKQLGLGSTS